MVNALVIPPQHEGYVDFIEFITTSGSMSVVALPSTKAFEHLSFGSQPKSDQNKWNFMSNVSFFEVIPRD